MVPGVALRNQPQQTKHARMLEVLAQFRIIFNSVRRHYRMLQIKTGLGAAQVWALSVISEHPGIKVGELAKLLLIHQSTASNLIRDLTRFGAISKVRVE